MVAPLRMNIVAPMRLHACHLRWECSELAKRRTMVDWMAAGPPLTRFWVGLLPSRRAVALMKPRSLRMYGLTGLLIHRILVFLSKNEIDPCDWSASWTPMDAVSPIRLQQANATIARAVTRSSSSATAFAAMVAGAEREPQPRAARWATLSFARTTLQMDGGINPSAISASSGSRLADMACRISDEVCWVRYRARRYSLSTRIGDSDGDCKCLALRFLRWRSYTSRVELA